MKVARHDLEVEAGRVDLASGQLGSCPRASTGHAPNVTQHPSGIVEGIEPGESSSGQPVPASV